MKRLLTLCLILFVFASQAQTNISVIYSFISGLGVTQQVKQASFTPIYNAVLNQQIITGDESFRVIPASGYLTNSWMLSGMAYRVKFFSSTQPPTVSTTFTNYFPTNLSGEVYASTYVTGLTNLGNGAWALTKAYADTLYQSIGATPSISTNRFDFLVSSTNVQPWKEGRVYYDQPSHTLAYFNDRSNVTVNVGQEQQVRVMNLTGLTISNGAAVTFTAGSGSIPRITLAQATTNYSAIGYDCVGLATEDIAQGSEGLVTTLGTVHGVNTDGWTTGSTLWLSTNAGAYTTNAPPANYIHSIIGVVARANNNNGDIFVAPQQAIHAGDITGLSSYVTNNQGGVNLSGAFSGNGGGLTNLNTATPTISNTNLYNYTPSVSWPNYSSLTVTGCTAFPFINGTNAYKPWSGSGSIFVNTNIAATNVFLFFESRPVGSLGSPAWVFANRPALTNTAASFVYEYDDSGSTYLPLNSYNVFNWTATDEASYDTTAIYANTYSSRTNLVVSGTGEIVVQMVDNSTADKFLTLSNVALGLPLMQVSAGAANSGMIGGITFYGIPFGQYVTNNQVNQVGFEGGKVNYTASYNQKSDHRMGLDLGVYFNTDASGGSMIERMVQQPTYYGTPNNGAGGWSRSFISHWKGTWLGDLNVADHTYNVIPPARLTVVASTNDIPMLELTNQAPIGNKQFSGALPNSSFWTDNTNVFLGQQGKSFRIPQLNQTNATLSAATSFTWTFVYPFADTNYSVSITGAGAALGTNVVIGAKTTTSVAITFPSFTGIANVIAVRQ